MLYYHRSSYLTHPGEGALGDTAEGYDHGVRGLSAVPGGSFGFLSPKIVLGRNIASSALKTAVKELKAKKPFIVTGKSGFARYASVLSTALEALLDPGATYAVSGEPTVEDAIAATSLATRLGTDVYHCGHVISTYYAHILNLFHMLHYRMRCCDLCRRGFSYRPRQVSGCPRYQPRRYL